MVRYTALTPLCSISLAALWNKGTFGVPCAGERRKSSSVSNVQYGLLSGGEYPGGPLRPDLVCNEDDFAPGTLPYTTGRVLGRGAFGTVLRAKRCGSKKYDLAVKQVHYRKCDASRADDCSVKTHGFDPVEIEPLMLNLPFVAELNSVFYSKRSQRVSVLMRLYEGGNLADYVHGVFGAGAKFSVRQIRSWGAQIAYGLWQLHRSRFIHNDLKTENVLIHDSPSMRPRQLVLSDFGLTNKGCDAKACTNRLVGTLSYAAPAKLKKQQYGFEVDWWSFGVIMSELAGALPYVDREDESLMIKILLGKPDLTHVKDSELNTFLSFILTRDSFDAKLGTDDARRLMVSERPSAHPILGHSFWHGSDNGSPADIDKFWSDAVCNKYSLHPEKCAGGAVSQVLPPTVACSSCEELNR
eukprot:TRINITY_DN16687_c0_g1_i1.p1 TRINITY_DN16687_c0_g1~~TRINITY_DN16687_c0_g1_i1.p1  ORF type:complete len:428 (-),score=44.02 TRINITY_DN16687_c0_g1_i1:150-1385(-)